MGKLALAATGIQLCNTGRSEPREALRYLKLELSRYLLDKMYRMLYFEAGRTVCPKRT